jgi:hypothetical protein
MASSLSSSGVGIAYTLVKSVLHQFGRAPDIDASVDAERLAAGATLPLTARKSISLLKTSTRGACEIAGTGD